MRRIDGQVVAARIFAANVLLAHSYSLLRWTHDDAKRRRTSVAVRQSRRELHSRNVKWMPELNYAYYACVCLRCLVDMFFGLRLQLFGILIVRYQTILIRTESMRLKMCDYFITISTVIVIWIKWDANKTHGIYKLHFTNRQHISGEFRMIWLYVLCFRCVHSTNRRSLVSREYQTL